MKKGTCKFYNGDFHNKCCDAGVDYRSVTTDPDNGLGIAFRKPCINWASSKGLPMGELQAQEWARRGTCAKYQEPTKEEIKAYDAEIEASMARFKTADKLILEVKKEHKGKDWHGVKECPVCKGKLHLLHSAFNGHVWGKCETEGCLSWMQ